MRDKSEVGSRRSEIGENSAAFEASVCEADADAGLHVLLIGDATHGEFRAAIETIESHGALAIVRDIKGALGKLEHVSTPFSLVIVAQARPGEYCDAEIDALRRAAPLAPIVALLGSLCEGETRSGKPWPGVIRVYWHQWRQRAGLELAALQAGRSSAWGLPATASEEERLLASAPRSFGQKQGVVAIAAKNFEMADWLADACRGQSWTAVCTPPVRPIEADDVAAVLWDAGLAAEVNANELAAIQAAFPAAPIVALADFLRIEQYERLLAAGVAAVLSKPVVLAELVWQLDEAVGVARNAERGTRSK
ncbi:MAG TPA: hypothetical protein VHB99_08075 [Pirellulales bacterium]|nr:hypothetical protein [Pirellulales bacterium]